MRKLQVSALVGLISACGPALSSRGREAAGRLGDHGAQKAVLADVTAQVILPTYQLLTQQTKALQVAASTFTHARSEPNLAALRTAWTEARRPWEQSEAFLFGPIETLGVDDNSDSWPVNKTDLTAVLNSNKDFTDAFVSSLDKNLRGFHAIEFLLFGDQGRQTAAAFTKRQADYLNALTKDLSSLSQLLLDSWTTGVQGQGPFKDSFAGAGKPGNDAFPTTTSALVQLVSKMADVTHELHESKLAVTDANLIESQFSNNSLKDFADNIRSVQNAYTTTLATANSHGHSLSELVSATDRDLDAKVKAQIATALTAVAAIPEPFSQSLQVPAAAPSIEAARAALTSLEDTLNKNVVAALNR